MSILSDWKIITVQLDNEATDLNSTELASISPELTQWLMAGGSNVSQITSSSNSLSESSSTTNVQWSSVIQNAMYSSWYVQGITWWRVTWLWDAEFNKGTFRWELKAASGTFKGSLVAASGTFSWSLVAWDIHIPSKDATASFHVNSWGNAWWWTTEALFNNNNENAVSFIKNNGTWKLWGSGRVVGTTRLEDELTLGSITNQTSGRLTFEYYPTKWDVVIRASKTDFGDFSTNWFIYGIDDDVTDSWWISKSLSDGSFRFLAWDPNNYIVIDQSWIYIRSNNADLIGQSTIAGKLTSVVVAQTNTKEELLIRAIDSVDEEELTRADWTIVWIMQSMPSSWTPVYLTFFSMYGKAIWEDVAFEFEYSMSTAETWKVVKLQIDYNVVDDNNSVIPSSYTGTISQEFNIINTANVKETLSSWVFGATLRIPAAQLTSNSQLIQMRISRINTWLSGSNHSWKLRIHTARIFNYKD